MTNTSLNGCNVLIVEDEYFIASDLTRVLRLVDVNVVGPVGNLTAGLDLAQSEAIDAAILDVNLEGTLSYALADWLTERAIPHAFITGYDGWSMPERYRDTPRITKPFAAATVIDVIAGLCAQGDTV